MVFTEHPSNYKTHSCTLLNACRKYDALQRLCHYLAGSNTMMACEIGTKSHGTNPFTTSPHNRMPSLQIHMKHFIVPDGDLRAYAASLQLLVDSHKPTPNHTDRRCDAWGSDSTNEASMLRKHRNSILLRLRNKKQTHRA